MAATNDYKGVMELLLAYVKNFTIYCERPEGRFGEDRCGNCPGCNLRPYLQAYREKKNHVRR